MKYLYAVEKSVSAKITYKNLEFRLIWHTKCENYESDMRQKCQSYKNYFN